MPALNFKSDFVDAIQNGTKQQTIRQVRSRPIQMGDPLYLYTGMRTAQCEKIGNAVCESVQAIEITDHTMRLDGIEMTTFQQMDMSRADGFRSDTDMRLFFQRMYGLPFAGVVIRFRLTPVAAEAAFAPVCDSDDTSRRPAEHDG